MEEDYEGYAKILKAVADPHRLKIIDILSCGEECACNILEHFDFTQPTLSHHMKILSECGLVNSRKDANWMMYSLNLTNANRMMLFLMKTITTTEDCICK
jgi:ArsR family transcriptional regulator